MIQNLVSSLPTKQSYDLYYNIQRKYGALKKGSYSPKSRLVAGVNIWKYILQNNQSAKDKIFFELGTGRAPIIPLANFLMGAKQTITVDLNPYMKEELCVEMLDYIFQNKEQVKKIFGYYLINKNFSIIKDEFINKNFSLQEFLNICNITYLTPLDATKTPLDSGSIDFYISYTVFEHIPKNILMNLIAEGNRLLNNDGLHIHRIDYSDHFSHSDEAISSINFLKFSEIAWRLIAGNKYMYMNRMRHDDFKELLKYAGCQIVYERCDIDENVINILDNNSLIIDKRFKSKSKEVLATNAAWFVAKRL